MRLQLWSCQYDPEPLGIGPISKVWAQGMTSIGHDVEVVAAHPHYPSPEWGSRLLPYRESRDGVSVMRLPLKIGRVSKPQRILQEMTFLASSLAASPFLGRADVQVSVSPSFPALLPALLNSKLRRTPWIIWLQDILPDGAASTGYVENESSLYRLSRKLEDAAYEAASKVVVLSETFRENLISKGVPDDKIELAYNPASFEVAMTGRAATAPEGTPRIICMGNIGKSQNLVAVVEAFEANKRLADLGARLVITGTGVAEAEVRAASKTERVELLGLVSGDRLELELSRAQLGIVTQSYEGGEFNVPSKLMNYLAIGLPVVASVNLDGEVSRIIDESGGGWVTDHRDLTAFTAALARTIDDQGALEQRSKAGVEFARENLSPQSLVQKFEKILQEVR